MANVYKRGFFVQEDYWLAVRGCSKKVQGEVIGALARLFFEGEDSAESLKGTSQSLYYAMRERVLIARTKSNARGGNQKGDQKGDQNPILLAKSESESEISTYDSTLSTPQPTREPPTPRALFIGEALKVFTEVTGRACLIPSAEVSFDLTKIFDAGYSIDDVRMVCEQQQAEWGADPKRQKWLRPHTLFGEKFEGYLAAAKAGTAKEERDAAAKFADAI
mgnify:CR=1 FL=1|nr:MAG TPA: hypothetical protein [Caudoviricetes sp.]